MNRIYKITFAAGLACFWLLACNMEDQPATDEVVPAKPIELTLRESEKATADNQFTFKIFREVSDNSEAPNVFFSPLSLNMALGMLYNGAAGDTRAEMAEVLGLADFTDAEINAYYQKMSQTLLAIDPLTEIAIANSIWHHNTFPVKQPFIDVNKKYFDAAVQALDFRMSDAADIINKWCADKTKDRIKDIIAKPIPDDVVMYLMNALYFKSQWQFEFDKKQTKPDDFTKVDGSKLKVNLMEQTASLPYYVDEYLQCVEMPYGNQAFSMMVILPCGDRNIDQLIDYLDNKIWEGVVNNLREQAVWLKLPRFKIECKIPLNIPVENVGMKRIFYDYLADFSNISTVPLIVSKIMQKTFVEVNEEGTEAAAVTVVEMAPTSVGPGPTIPFHANRPFLYLIKEKSTGVILFIGRMDEPN